MLIGGAKWSGGGGLGVTWELSTIPDCLIVIGAPGLILIGSSARAEGGCAFC